MKTITLITFVVLLFGLINLSCNSQKTIINQDEVDSFMKRKIKEIKTGRWRYPKYEGKVIVRKNNNSYVFNYEYNDSVSVTVSDKYYSDYMPLFENGYLHPGNISYCRNEKRSVVITQFKEYRRIEDVTKRSYNLWSWCSGYVNPCEYTVVLLNEEASEDMSTKDFIKNAIVISISHCSIII